MEIGGWCQRIDTHTVIHRVNMECVYVYGYITRHVRFTLNMKVCGWGQCINTNPVCGRIDEECICVDGKV